MKRGWTVLLCLGLMCGLSTAVQAATEKSETGGSTEITTQVPDSHMITIDQENAEVFVNGEMTERITAERLSTPTVLIRAKSGYQIDRIMLDRTDITKAVIGGYYTFEPIHDDHVLKVRTVKTVSDDTELYTINARVTRKAVPAAGIRMELRSTVQTKVSDQKGTVVFDKVESGFHSLTALENNKVTGYVEFTLKSDRNEKEITVVQKGTGVYQVLVNPDYDNLELTFDLKEDGRIVIKANSASKREISSLKTGDNAAVIYLAAGLTLAGLMIRLMKKNTKNS